MPTPTIRQGDYGTVFDVTVDDQDGNVFNLATATSLQIIFVKPDGSTRVAATPTLKTDGTDGIVQYVFPSGMVDQAGTWQSQVVVAQTGKLFHSDIIQFRVGSNL